jgi:hypothetical protein
LFFGIASPVGCLHEGFAGVGQEDDEGWEGQLY